ncbi:MAG: M48 family metalloprotease [Patescibacteria group bacterium]|nr:M48 family metalloprotease [Patescibacteria group bacterium]
MPNVYNQISSNIRKTWFFITLFLLVILFLGWVLSYIFDSELILIIAFLFSTISAILSYWYSDKIVLSLTRAEAIQEKDAPELYRVVYNLAITAGMPTPKVYIIPEAQPNAFATGRDEKHAVVAVTAGLLQKLERVELEGVIAHEISHIKNRDTLLQTVVVILAGIVTLLANWILRAFFWGRGGNDEDSGGGGILVLILGLVTAIIAPIAATLIQLAISRKREFLADASSALLTRYPEGLARALEKIAQDKTPMRVAQNYNAHLFITSPFKGRKAVSFLAKLFSTHPPVEERIRILREKTGF